MTSVRARRHVPAVVIAVMLVAAAGVLVLEPWHGSVVLALSEQHGVDVGDLPAVALLAIAVAVWHARPPRPESARRSWAAGRIADACAVVLGALLLAGILFPRVGSPLVPAGGGTFNGDTKQVGGLRAEPVGRWSHLAVTYDGRAVRLYVDGVEVSSRPMSGTIRRTTDPLWIGGNRPYGEYFHGAIDDVRIYGRALRPAEVRAAMSTPIASDGAQVPGLVAAYAFDAGSGRTVADASGNGNAGRIRGARWTNSGRFGRAMSFDGGGDVVRVPASPSLDLTNAMTLTAWIRPSESQSGWRTVVARQTDAYTLMAGGGQEDAGRLEALDELRFGVVMLLVAVLGVALALGHVPWPGRRRRWYWPVGLFVTGSVVDVAVAPANALIGPTLVAVWFAASAAHRDDRLSMSVLSAAFAVVTIVSIADAGLLPLPEDDGGTVRAGALGLLLATAGVLSRRHTARDRTPLRKSGRFRSVGSE